MILLLHLKLAWARLTRNDHLIIATWKEILMADFTAFNASVDRVAAKVQADAAALAAAGSADADVQSQIDAATAKLDAIVPPPAADPVAEAEQPAG